VSKNNFKAILVVDDEEVVRALCCRLLIPMGYSVESAADGRQALILCQDKPFDLVLTDYSMPGGLNGLDLGREIKRQFVRIIFMSAFPEMGTTVEMLRIGASDCLVKPFDKTELLSRVKHCLEKTEHD
jgi:DNA-binding response OmpR family regulator